MANYEGKARTNYFKIKSGEPVESLIEEMKRFGIEVHGGSDGHYCLIASTDDGDWPTSAIAYNSVNEETGEASDEVSIDFSFEEFVMPHVAEGEVVVAMSIGSEKLRYLNGRASAYMRTGDDDVQAVSLSINDIYEKASKQFKVHVSNISDCSY